MKKTIKSVVYGLTGIMLLASLSACGKKQDDSAAAAQTEAAAAAESAAETTTETAAETTSETAEETTQAQENVTAELNSEWPESLEPGDVFTDFTAPLTDGQEFSLSEALKDHKAVLINIWATYCGPCKEEFPDMNEVYKEYSDDVAFVCLSGYMGDTAEDIAAYKEAMGLDMPMGVRVDDLCDSAQIQGFPTTIIVDRFGHYAFKKVGAFSSARSLKSVLDEAISDDYTEPQILEIKKFKSETAALPDDELSAAVCSDGTLHFTTPDDEYCWPFVKDTEGVINSNAFIDNSECTMETTVDAKAGDVFGFDYSIDSREFVNCLAVTVNGNNVRMINGQEDGTYAYTFPEDGTYDIQLTYKEKGFVKDTTETVNIKNATLATGDAVAALMAKVKTFPQTLDGTDMTVELNGARPIVFYGVDNINEDMTQYGDEYYVADSDTLDVHVCLGKDLDPYNAVLTSTDGETYVMAKSDTDDTGFICTETIGSGVENGDYCYTMMKVYSNCWSGDGKRYFIFPDEENANYFVKSQIQDENTGETVEGAAWKYADGTMPSTDEVAEEKSEQTLNADGTATYTIHIVDENGNPVDGCIVNICTDVSCQPTVVNGGELTFTKEPYTYIVHVIKYPDGYIFDTSQEFTMSDNGGELTITVPHAN